jgi:outer membrane protein TolC
VKRFAIVAAALGGLASSRAGADPLTVGDCVRLALERSPSVHASAFTTEAARMRVRAARGAFLPSLSAEGEYGRSTGYDVAVTNGGSSKAVVKVDATVIDGGTRLAELSAARARAEGASQSEREERAAVVFAVREAYFTALAAAEEIAVRDEALRTLAGDIELLGRQERSGLVPRNAVLRARISEETTNAARRGAVAQSNASRSALHVLAGVDGATLSLVDPGEPPPAIDLAHAVEDIPAVAAARSAVEVAKREVDAVDRERFGKLTFSADAGALGVYPTTTFRDDRGAEFLFGVRVPLFDSVAEANRAAARAELGAAAAALERAEQAARLELAQLGDEIAKTRADLEASRRTLPLSEQNLELMRARHAGGGDVRLLELLDALGEHVNARLEVSHALLAHRLAQARAAKLLGDSTP